ncbi:hypothetical protein [Mycobacterium palustre]|uniref:Uncharacterized protein n=1 Tax=Mycobacterium palustre TaxID=153971 RepID=A0A1X1Z2Y8_9MYCO|nr:hypothetical protein [Mycobacterium palustre]MCV7099645.1 hypothetical protein [Mycobacterium palustre]ORW17688.1 hypothetical protein AWC19_20620 [Mycobacterium palustre]
MHATHTMTRAIAGALLSAGVAVTGFGLAEATASARPGLAPQVKWCPGQALPSSGEPITWDMSVCHEWHSISDPGHNPPYKVVEGSLPPQPGFPFP